jgi:hypothetical protein
LRSWRRGDDDHPPDLQVERLTLLSADINRREACIEQPLPQLSEGEGANRETDDADAAATDDEAIRFGPPSEQMKRWRLT